MTDPLPPRAPPAVMPDCRACGRQLRRRGSWEQQAAQKFCSHACHSAYSMSLTLQGDPERRRVVHENLAMHYDALRATARTRYRTYGIDADDLVNETICAILRWPTYDPAGSAAFTTWAIYVMDIRFKIMFREKKEREELQEAFTTHLMRAADGRWRRHEPPYHDLPWRESVDDAVLRPLESLPAVHREIAMRYWVYEDPMHRIAHDMHMTVEQGFARLHYAVGVVRASIPEAMGAHCRPKKPPVPPPPPRICIFPDCGRKRRARDYCNTHKEQMRRTGRVWEIGTGKTRGTPKAVEVPR